MVVKDRIKEREALFASFFCMDEDYSMKLEYTEFKALFDIVYSEKLKDEQIQELFDLLDEDRKNYLNLDDFFGVIDLIENNKNLTKPKPIENKIWNQ